MGAIAVNDHNQPAKYGNKNNQFLRHMKSLGEGDIGLTRVLRGIRVLRQAKKIELILLDHSPISNVIQRTKGLDYSAKELPEERDGLLSAFRS